MKNNGINKRGGAVKSKARTARPSPEMPKAPVKNNLRRNRRRRQKRRQQGGCLAFIIGILLMIGLLLAISAGFKKWAGSWWDAMLSKSMTEEVLNYEAELSEAAAAYGISDYTGILMSIMMQESKGRGNDPMQSSECMYNTDYEQVGNGIQDPLYSIWCGTAYFAHCLSEAGCESLQDYDRLMLAIQGYNFGSGYIEWAKNKEGGWSEENARVFSDEMKAVYDLNIYGDPQYASKVMTYYETLVKDRS